jgi:hypothetical protein
VIKSDDFSGLLYGVLKRFASYFGYLPGSLVPTSPWHVFSLKVLVIDACLAVA